MAKAKLTPTPRLLLQLFLVIILIPFSALLISRDWDWWQAWVFVFFSVFGFVVSRVLANRAHPDLLAERARMVSQENTAPWDRVLSPMLGLGGGLIPIVAGLDRLFVWSSDFSDTTKWVALVFISLGYVIGTLALVENRYFSGVVRLQTDRGHKVVTTGPYRLVRHPGYLGVLFTFGAGPFFLDSRWGILITIALLIVLLIRTKLEDDFLQEKLEGYRAYTEQTPYRLIPGIW